MKGHLKLLGFQNSRIQLLLLCRDKMSVCVWALIVKNAYILHEIREFKYHRTMEHHVLDKITREKYNEIQARTNTPLRLLTGELQITSS